MSAAANDRFVAPETRALFCIATCRLTEDDRPASRRMGVQLYDHLTRNRNDPLAFGAGIPVAIDFDINWMGTDGLERLAENVLLVILAGTDSILLEPEAAAARLESLNYCDTKITKLLVPTDGRWRAEAERIPSVHVADTVFGETHAANACDDVLLAAGQCLDAIAQSDEPTLGDLSANKTQWSKPRLYVSGNIWQSRLRSGIALSSIQAVHHLPLMDYFHSMGSVDQLTQQGGSPTEGALDAVLISVRRDRPGEVRLHDRELILAKRQGWPIVSVSHAIGNSEETPFDWYPVLRQATVAHLHYKHFHLVARRIINASGLPINTSVIGNAPDLFDMTIGALSKSPTRTVLHPDPALTPENREVLRAAAPLVHAVTPSTLMGRGVREDAAGRLVSPLDSVSVGISVGNIPQVDLRMGQTALHLQDATVQITRSLIDGGASIVYGGRFLIGDDNDESNWLGHSKISFTPLLAELIEAYNQTARMPAERLQVFQTARSELDDVPPSIRCRIRHLGKSSDLALEPMFTPEQLNDLPPGLEYSDMRRSMTQESDARIAIGGHPYPEDKDRSGYSGRFPEIAEDVLRALRCGQPVYLCGGYGGITRRITELMQCKPEHIDHFWNDQLYGFNKLFTSLAWDVDNHDAAKRLKLPINLMELAKEINQFSNDMELDDEAWLDFNGLTLEQNRVLWQTVDPILLSSLISEGLLRWRTRRRSMDKKFQIEAIHGNVTSVTRADVLAISVFDDIDPQGAGAAIDRVTGGMVRQAQQVPGRLIGVRSDQLDVDYLCAVSLGNATTEQGDSGRVLRSVRKAAREIMTLCHKEGFESLAVVTFGGSSVGSYSKAVNAMMKGFASVTSSVLIKWVEADAEKFDQLISELKLSPHADTTTVLKPNEALPTPRYPWFNLTVKYRDGILDVTALARKGSGVAWTRNLPLSSAEVDALCKGAGITGHQTPNLSTLKKRGLQISELLFGDNADVFWKQCHDVPIAITHDEEASRIPFELMRFKESIDNKDTPAIGKGIHRWLAVGGGRLSSSFGRPRLSRKLRIGLVVDPTNDLPGARAEGLQIKKVLQAMGDKVQFQCLGGEDDTADLQNVTDMLRQVDVLHYCGHAFFSDEDRSQSGLKLHDGEILTSEKLESVEPIPRVLIFNACQACRVRSDSLAPENHDSYSLAEMVLRGGVEAFVGTFWEVNDQAASAFASRLYTELSSGLSLRESVTIARQKLAADKLKDWANYCLFGDGRFQLA